MARKEFAANIIQGVDRLISKLNSADVEIARELLDATYEDYPRPPWNTGELRSSGAAYIGSKLVAMTPFTPPNPNGQYAKGKKASGSGSLERGVSRENVYSTMRMRTLKQATEGLSNITTVRGKITIIYHSPVAALMHEWQGNFSDPESGAHYISLKLMKADRIMGMVFREVFKRVI